MMIAPLLIALSAIAVLHALRRGQPVTRRSNAAAASSATLQRSAEQAAPPSSDTLSARALSELEGKPADSLSSQELVLLAAERAQQHSNAAHLLSRKVQDNPALGQESAVQADLLRLVDDPRTAPEALAAIAALEPPLGADLLYEVWTKTAERTEASELAHALLYSTDVRPKASPALSVALLLRAADSCEQYKAILPKALQDGDRRSLHLLAKLNSKRGCGPNKSKDCYVCLRKPSDELAATLSAVKARRAPGVAAP
jgi:hypothetical protein